MTSLTSDPVFELVETHSDDFNRRWAEYKSDVDRRRQHTNDEFDSVVLSQIENEIREAFEYLRAYTGTFEFLLDIKKRIDDDPWYELSEKQISAILRCKANEQRPKSIPAKTDGPNLSTLRPGTGYYAVTNEGGTLSFFRVDNIVEEGNRWDGWAFVQHIVGGTDDLYGEKIGRQRPGETYSGLFPHLLQKVVDDPKGSQETFGRSIGRCGVCGKVLTDETSRAFGIGPICREGWGA
jgi:hypothetical protein